MARPRMRKSEQGDADDRCEVARRRAAGTVFEAGDERVVAIEVHGIPATREDAIVLEYAVCAAAGALIPTRGSGRARLVPFDQGVGGVIVDGLEILRLHHIGFDAGVGVEAGSNVADHVFDKFLGCRRPAR